MQYIYAAMMLHKAGKQITEDALEKVLTAAGAEADKARIKATVTALSGVDIDKVISEASAVPVAAPASAQAGGEKKAEKPKEEEKKSDEEAAAGLGALFG